MRTRSTTIEDTYSATGAKQWRKTVPGGTPIPGTSTASGNRVVKTIIDVETPGFLSLLKCGEFLPLNPVTIRTESFLNRPAKFFFNIPNWEYWGERMIDRADPSQVTPWWKNLIPPANQSLVDAVKLASMANAVGAKWDVLTFLAELSSTIATIHHYGKRFNLKVLEGLQTWRNMRRGKLRNADRFLRKEWLAARYGIRPIIGDIETAVASIKRLLNEVALVKGNGYQESEDLYSNTTVFDEGVYGVTTRTRSITAKRIYRGAAYLEIDTSVAGNVQVDPIVTAYELVPYSFVVDRFVNIGAWLQTLTPSLLGEYAGSQYSIRSSITAHSVCVTAPKPEHTNWMAVPCDSSYVVEEYLRVPTAGIPPFPGFNPRITLAFAVDLVALFLKGKSDTMKLASRR